MFCHTGPRSLAFLVGWLILMDSDLQIQISKKWIVAYTEFSYINITMENCDVAQSLLLYS